MAQTASSMLPLGTAAPDFKLPDVVSGRSWSLDDFPAAQPLLVMFICRHCPYVKHVQDELARLGRDYAGRAALLAISANDAEAFPEDAPESLREMAQQLGFRFPLLYDQTQATARAYQATCTPDFFVFDGKRRLAYRGQLDGSRPGGAEPVTGRDVRAALEALLAGRPVAAEQRASLGCNIKWKAA